MYSEKTSKDPQSTDRRFKTYRKKFRKQYVKENVVDLDGDEDDCDPPMKACLLCNFQSNNEYRLAAHYSGSQHISSENKFLREEFGVEDIYELYKQKTLTTYTGGKNQEDDNIVSHTEIIDDTNITSQSESEENRHTAKLPIDDEVHSSLLSIPNSVEDSIEEDSHYNPTPFLPLQYQHTLAELHKISTHLDEESTTNKLTQFSKLPSMSKKDYVSDDMEPSNLQQFFGSADLLVKLTSPLMKSVRDFHLYIYPIETSDRQRLMDKHNKKWQSEFANELYQKDKLETPHIFTPTSENKRSYQEQEWYSKILQKMVDEYNSKLTNGSYNHVMTSDPIFCIRRFPNWCWALDMTDIIKFFDLQRTYTKFKDTFKSSNFCSMLNIVYPNMQLVELNMKHVIARSKQEYILLRRYELELQKGILNSKKDSDLNSDISNDLREEELILDDCVDDEKDKDQQKDDDDEQDITQDYSSLSNMEWIDILLPKVKRSSNEINQKRIDKLCQKEEIETDKKTKDLQDCKKRRGRPGNDFRERVLPIVLLPFFIDSLHVSKKIHNPIFMICNDILRKLENYRHILVMEKHSTSEQIACLDLTIMQLKVNLDTYTNYKHITTINTEIEKGELSSIISGITSVMNQQQQQLAACNSEIKKMQAEIDKLTIALQDGSSKSSLKRKLSGNSRDGKISKKSKNV